MMEYSGGEHDIGAPLLLSLSPNHQTVDDSSEVTTFMANSGELQEVAVAELQPLAIPDSPGEGAPKQKGKPKRELKDKRVSTCKLPRYS